MDKFTAYLLEGKIEEFNRTTEVKDFKFKNITNHHNHKFSHPFVITQSSVLGIGVNSIYIDENSEITLKYQFNDTRLLTVEEYDRLLTNLIKETLNEEALKLYRKYTALKNITN